MAPVHSEAYRAEMAALQSFTRTADGASGPNHKIVPLGADADAAAAAAAAQRQACVHCGGIGGASGSALPFSAGGAWFCGARCLKAHRAAGVKAQSSGETG